MASIPEAAIAIAIEDTRGLALLNRRMQIQTEAGRGSQRIAVTWIWGFEPLQISRVRAGRHRRNNSFRRHPPHR